MVLLGLVAQRVVQQNRKNLLAVGPGQSPQRSGNAGQIRLHRSDQELGAVLVGNKITEFRGQFEFTRPEELQVRIREFPVLVNEGADSTGHGDTELSNNSAKTSTGFFHPSVLRGRSLSSSATLSRSAWVCNDRSVPFGKYCRNKPLVFSLVPRCHGE